MSYYFQEYLKILFLSILTLLIGATYNIAMSSDNAKWQGEWGKLETIEIAPHTQNTTQYVGGTLSITGCTENECNVSLHSSTKPSLSCSAHGVKLIIKNSTRADIYLPGVLNEPKYCHLILNKSDTHDTPVIHLHVEQANHACDQYCNFTPPPYFVESYPLRSYKEYHWGQTASDLCYADNHTVIQTLCTSPELQALHKEMIDVIIEIPQQIPGQSNTTDSDPIMNDIIHACKASTIEPVECLTKRFQEKISLLRQERDTVTGQYNAFLDKLNQPASLDAANSAINKIEGTYIVAHEVEIVNDEPMPVQDLLEITRKDERTIHFNVDLSAVNGHSCEMQGDAYYASTGDFVYKESGNNKEEEEEPGGDKNDCLLLIKMDESGSFSFNDVYRTCSDMYCSARAYLSQANFPADSKQRNPGMRKETSGKK